MRGSCGTEIKKAGDISHEAQEGQAVIGGKIWSASSMIGLG